MSSLSTNLTQKPLSTSAGNDSAADTGPVCVAKEISHSYGTHAALRGVSLCTRSGQVFALLGPNGSGKTTLFRLLSTLMPIQHGSIRVGGYDSHTNPLAVRRQIGIVFQSPSLDNKLTVDENIACQGALYGITGKQLNERRDELLEQLNLTSRRRDYCESLSGGLKRRVELVKGMLHRPRLLLLDEPSTGLDPAARLDLWASIRQMCDQGTSVLLTTHLLEEADKADRVAIMHQGEKIVEGTPAELRAELGDGVITIEADSVDEAEQILRQKLGLDPQRFSHQLRLQSDEPSSLVPQISEHLGGQLQSITIGRPSLEDVFIVKTGHKFR
ncbi:Daunorubicin/doxorubicin resistance ATP-binding protein DrrA [Novipirellula aureliae]|uniref:Daunorubicin/doxorubicin resistance ATP-binding protein DrrA n=1 Tax=Novipirellula aureliae TaxID=2527966 RepID=A0A5C6EDV6_9BACT|nr:Daunorubicin/doxorubicin resistance ATP-binding protein DrrA [Novipirellula aureliae]